MKLIKMAAAVFSLTLMCGAVTFNNVYMNDSAVFAEEYIEGTYGVLTYRNYGGYIEISDCDPDAVEVEIPSEIDGLPVMIIGEGAFEGQKYLGVGNIERKKLSSITIPDSVVIIEDNAFDGCQYLKSITIPDSVVSIDNSAFADCPSLTSVTFPEHHISIGDKIFDNTPWLENQRSKNPLVIINNMVIDGLTCEGDVNIPYGVTSILGSAFKDNDNLTGITIPGSVTSVDKYAFCYCDSLESLIFPDSVSYIEWGAFSHCLNLKKVTVLNPDCQLYAMFYNGTIYGFDNSTAQDYAETDNIEFISLGEYVEILLGDTDLDGVVNSSDASKVLSAYAITATGGKSPLSDIQKTAADVNKDDAVDSSDASSILAYYAYTATGGEGTIEEFLR